VREGRTDVIVVIGYRVQIWSERLADSSSQS
jgi:hypothetical protein